MIYHENCRHFTRKENKAGYITRYCKSEDKYLSGLKDCDRCRYFEYAMPDEDACYQDCCPKGEGSRCCFDCEKQNNCEEVCENVILKKGG